MTRRALLIGALLLATTALAACGDGGDGEEGSVETPTATSTPDPLAAGRAAEADDSPDLPGEWIDLASIYGGPYTATAQHTTDTPDYSEQGLPPAGGPHWSGGVCGPDPAEAPPQCGPVQRGFYVEPWPAPSLVHSMEHAHVVLWYHTGDAEVLERIRDFTRSNSDRLLIVTPYPEMEPETVAITAWSRRLVQPVDDLDIDALQEFLEAHECRFDPEQICSLLN